MLICEKTQNKIQKNPDKALIGLIFRLTQYSDTHASLGCVGIRKLLTSEDILCLDIHFNLFTN